MFRLNWLFFAFAISALIHLTLLLFFNSEQFSRENKKEIYSILDFSLNIEPNEKKSVFSDVKPKKLIAKEKPQIIEKLQEPVKSLTKPPVEETALKPDFVRRKHKKNDSERTESDLKTPSTVGKFPILVYFGEYEFGSEPVGKGVLEFTVIEKEKYTISLTAEAIGWTKFFLRKPLAYKSEGRFSTGGFIPEYYEMVTPKRGKSYASVDYKKAEIYFSSIDRKTEFDGNIYDPLSLIFQIALLADVNDIFATNYSNIFSVFSRKKVDNMTVLPAPSQEVVLPDGSFISALRIKSQLVSGSKKGLLEFWLDPSDGHLPVRIALTDLKKDRKLEFLVLRGKDQEINKMIKNQPSDETKKKSHPYHQLY